MVHKIGKDASERKVIDLAVRALRSGEITDLSLPSDALLNGYPCVFVQVPEAEYLEAFPLYQIVWPSREAKFPWHPDASQEFRRVQPVLGLHR